MTARLTYSSRGELLESVVETDQATPGGEVDGLIDAHQTATFEYDADGNVIRQVAVAGQTGCPSTTSITVMEYDSRGQLVQSTTEYDFDADGTLDQITVVSVAYDGVKP